MLTPIEELLGRILSLAGAESDASKAAMEPHIKIITADVEKEIRASAARKLAGFVRILLATAILKPLNAYITNTRVKKVGLGIRIKVLLRECQTASWLIPAIGWLERGAPDDLPVPLNLPEVSAAILRTAGQSLASQEFRSRIEHRLANFAEGDLTLDNGVKIFRVLMEISCATLTEVRSAINRNLGMDLVAEIFLKAALFIQGIGWAAESVPLPS